MKVKQLLKSLGVLFIFFLLAGAIPTFLNYPLMIDQALLTATLTIIYATYFTYENLEEVKNFEKPVIDL